MKKNAFTLIEMLMVLVLMGLIIVIGIPTVVRIITNKSNEQYQVQIKMIEKATDLYALRYQGDLKEHRDETQCFLLDYKVLLDEGLMNEDNIVCHGTIVLNKKGKNDYKNDYYLNCIDKTNNKELSNYNSNDIPTECISLAELQDVVDSNVPAPTIKGGSSEWTSSDVIIELDNPGIPESEVLRYEAYKSNSPKTPSRNVTATVLSGNNQVKIQDNGTTYVWYRVVNKKNEVSNWSNRQDANIDKIQPGNFIITASDEVATGYIHSKEFILSFGGLNNISGNVYKYGLSNEDSALINEGNYVEIDRTYNNKTIYVKGCSLAGNCYGTIKSYEVKFD